MSDFLTFFDARHGHKGSCINNVAAVLDANAAMDLLDIEGCAPPQREKR
jgi:hypothetical protein